MDIKSPNHTLSPFMMNSMKGANYLMPGGNNARCYSPMNLNAVKTPKLSPIVKPGTPLSETKFLRKRDAMLVKARIDLKSRRKTCFDAPSSVIHNPILEKTISVKSTLQELKLEHLIDIFMREEINSMAIFFTLTNADLEFIGIECENERKKILEFIASMKTPTKKIACRY